LASAAALIQPAVPPPHDDDVLDALISHDCLQGMAVGRSVDSVEHDVRDARDPGSGGTSRINGSSKISADQKQGPPKRALWSDVPQKTLLRMD